MRLRGRTSRTWRAVLAGAASCLSLVAGAGTARAVPVPPEVAACAELPEGVRSGADVRRVDDAGTDGGDRVLHLVAGRARYLVFASGGATPRCDVWPVGRASGRVQGRFWPGRERVKAFLLVPPDCAEERCRPVVALRELGGEERVLAAVRPGFLCDAGATLTAREVFADLETVQVDCSCEAGAAAFLHHGALVHALAGGLAVVFEGSLGYTSASSGSEDEESGEHCVWGPDAELRVVARGAAPRLEHLDREPCHEVPGDETRRIGTLSTWEFDAASGRFRKTAERPRTYTRSETCTPLPRR